MIQISSKKKWWKVYLLFVSVFAASTILAYRMITMPDVYQTDILPHISFAREGVGYSFLYKIMGVIIALSGNYWELSIAVLYGLLVVWSAFEVGRWLQKKYPMDKVASYSIGIGMTFLCSVYIPFIHPYFYILSFVTQPWHNITYFAMRPFAIITMIYLTGVLECYTSSFTFRNWLSIAIPLVLSTSIKPNFLLAFSWTLLIFIIYDFGTSVLRGGSVGKAIKVSVELGTVVFPSLAVLIYDSTVLYTGDNGFTFTIKNELLFQNRVVAIVWMFIIAFVLPILICILYKKGFSRIEKFAFLQFAISMFQAVFLIETGSRMTDGNFFWTVFIGSFLLYALLIGRLLGVKKPEQGVFSKYIRVGCYVWISAMLFSGVCYFLMCLISGYFWV